VCDDEGSITKVCQLGAVFIIKLGSRRYFRSKRCIHWSNMLVGTIMYPGCELWENEVMNVNRSSAILWANAKRSSTPDVVKLKFSIVASLIKVVDTAGRRKTTTR